MSNIKIDFYNYTLNKLKGNSKTCVLSTDCNKCGFRNFEKMGEDHNPVYYCWLFFERFKGFYRLKECLKYFPEWE